LSSFLDSEDLEQLFWVGMETPQAWRERIRHEQELIAHLRIAALRFVDAQTERMWAMVAAQWAGFSVRQIGAATALSASRVHQIISAPEATEIPQWLNESESPRARPTPPAEWMQASPRPKSEMAWF
jgi:hypothetical protein